jgi:hypothetical protein
MPLIKHLANNDTVSLKLVLRDNFYKKANNAAELGILVFREGTTFPELATGVGTKKTIFAVVCLIQNFCNQFNFGSGKNMNVQQVVDFATDLTTSFIDRKGNAVRFEEIAIFFDRAGKNEFKKKNGQPFIFDRIDRLVIEEMMDHYFETDRTAAVWALEDQKRNRERLQLESPEPVARMTADEYALTVGDIYTRLAGKPGALKLQKLISKALSDETASNDGEAIPGVNQ